MTQRPAPPAATAAHRAGAAGLASLDGVDVLDELSWNPGAGAWMLRVRITIAPGTDDRVPRRTTWFVEVPAAYPAGTIRIFPAKVGGIVDTFPHQQRNSPGAAGTPWRAGHICVHDGGKALGRLGGSSEPLEPDRRLAWYLQRAVAWVSAAANDRLNGPGDPFELPDFGASDEEVLAFAEDSTTFRVWEEAAPTCGAVDLFTVPGTENAAALTAVRAFRDPNGTMLLAPSWGDVFGGTSGQPTEAGLWVRFPEVLHLEPWRAPEAWGELRGLAEPLGFDLNDLVLRSARKLRRQKRVLLLCGFPMPRRIGDQNAEYSWQAVRLPPLAPLTGGPKGFRDNEPNRRFVDRLRSFRADAPLTWLRSENWHPESRSVRGRLGLSTTTRRVLLIGAGAVGSAVAELLVRGGIESLVLSDSESVMAGNLARHTLTLADVGVVKSVALTRRLRRTSPHVQVAPITTFPPTRPQEVKLARDVDLVIDCTADDEVAYAMANFDWGAEKDFMSLSLDWHARRSFFFGVRATAFPAAEFLDAVHRILGKDPERDRAGELAREGVGCWHPVMPARIDDVWMHVAAAVRYLNGWLERGSPATGVVVFERDDSPEFAGVRRV